MAKYNFWSFCQDGVAMLFAVPTYGASLLVSPTARGIVKNITGLEKDDDINKNLELQRLRDEQAARLKKTYEDEINKIRKEREDQEKLTKKNNDEIARLNSIINNPQSSEEEKKNARNRIVLLEGENKTIKKTIDSLNKKVEELLKNPPKEPSLPWTLPKFSLLDKVLITSGVVLIVYLIIPDKKK